MRYKINENLLFVVLEREEKIEESLKNLILEKLDIKTGIVLSATGMIKEVEIGYGYYENENVRYEKVFLNGPFELLSLSGVLIKNENYPFHLHITLGDKNLNAIGGHFFDGKVHTFVEMFILLNNLELKRKIKEGLNIINL